MSGFDVCRQIKTDPRTAAIPVIQVSATAVEVADRAHGLTQGADAYLVEPTEPEELLATVTAALRYYRARTRAERTAAMLAALASTTLDINAAETFDGLAAAAAVGAARMFSVPVVLMLEMPDGQVRRMSALPGGLVPVRRGGPPGTDGPHRGTRARPGQEQRKREHRPGRLAGHRARQHAARGRLRGDGAGQVRQGADGDRGRPHGPVRRGGHADPPPARAVGRARRRSPALVRGRPPGGHDSAAQLPARGAARDTGPCDGVPLPAGQRSGRGRRGLLRGAALAGRGPDRHRRRARALAARRDGDGRAQARAARFRHRSALAGRDHRPGQRGAAALPPGHDGHLVPGARRAPRPASSRSSTAGTCRCCS